MSFSDLAQSAHTSGGILYIMAILLLVVLTIIVERGWYLSRIIRKGDAVSRHVAEQHHLEPETIARLASETADLPHGMLLDTLSRNPEVREHARLAELLEEGIMRQVPLIDRRLWLLDTIVTLAPLLGLLGTIIGMLNTFHVLAAPGNASAQVTGGVGEALVATASGLFIAIIGLVFFNGMSNRVRIIVHQMETLKVMLINRCGRLPVTVAPVREMARKEA